MGIGNTIRSWFGVLSSAQLNVQSSAIIDSCELDDGEYNCKDIETLLDLESELKSWQDELSETIKRIAKAGSKLDQMLKIRMELIRLMKAKARAGALFDGEFSDASKQMITNQISPGTIYSKYDHQIIFIKARASTYILQQISKHDNFEEGGWFDILEDAINQQTMVAYFNIIKKYSKEKVPQLSLSEDEINQQVEDIERDVLKG